MEYNGDSISDSEWSAANEIDNKVLCSQCDREVDQSKAYAVPLNGYVCKQCYADAWLYGSKNKTQRREPCKTSTDTKQQ